MIDEIKTVMWKEWKETILSQRGSSRGMTLFRVVFAVFIFGVVFPLRSGPRYVESAFSLIVPSIAPVLMIIGIVTDSFAGERERHTLETLLASQLRDEAILIGKMLTGVLFALSVFVVMLVLGLIGANLSAGHDHLLMFPATWLFGAFAFNLLFALVMSAAGVLVSVRASTVRQAMQTLSIGVMVLFYGGGFGFFFFMPAEWKARLIRFFLGQNLFRTELMAAAFLFTVFAILFSAARLRFRRARLILD